MTLTDCKIIIENVDRTKKILDLLRSCDIYEVNMNGTDIIRFWVKGDKPLIRLSLISNIIGIDDYRGNIIDTTDDAIILSSIIGGKKFLWHDFQLLKKTHEFRELYGLINSKKL